MDSTSSYFDSMDKWQSEIERMVEFQKELQKLINVYSVDSTLGVPDYLIAEYICDQLKDLGVMVNKLEFYIQEKEKNKTNDGHQ